MKRYVIEFGTGIDFHGQDVTGAACKAVKNAISQSCLCGLSEIFGITDLDNMVLEITIAVPEPEKVNKERVLTEVPFGQKSIQLKEGGMRAPGLYMPDLGDRDESIMVANACIEVKIDTGKI